MPRRVRVVCGVLAPKVDPPVCVIGFYLSFSTDFENLVPRIYGPDTPSVWIPSAYFYVSDTSRQTYT